MINVYKSPISKEKYANLFLDKIPENVRNVCLLFIGHSETVHYIMSQKPEIDFTVIDGSDVTEALPYIYTGNNLKNTISFEEVDCEEDIFLKKLKDSFENYIMNNMSSFDLIIANPPYKASTHAKIAKLLMDKKCAKEYVFLCPTSLLTGYSANCVSLRENYKVDEFEYIGSVDFGGIKPDVSIYYFGFGEEKKDWKTLQLEMKPTIEKEIAEKCAKVECLHYDWFKENLSSRAAQDLKKKLKDLTKEEIKQWQIDKMQEGESFICNSVYSNSKADGIVLKSQMSYASSWYGPKELIPKLKNDLYKGLAVMFSTNKRDQQARTLSQLPVDLESCGFTEEEKEYLLKLSRGSKEHD